MERSFTGIVRCNTYEIHYCSDLQNRTPVEGPIVVYFPLTGEAWESRFVPRPGLADRASVDFDPGARPVSKAGNLFTIRDGAIVCSNPFGLTGVVERLLERGAMAHVFARCEPPPARWENVSLTRLPLPASLDIYCAALREKYANGFVECHMYSVAEGELEDTVISFKNSWSGFATFLEILRHPMVMSDFQVSEADENLLISRENWTGYSPFLFSGFLAQTLAYGGAYTTLNGQAEISISLAAAVFDDLNRDFRNFELNCCHKPWCRRFFDIAWDHTWIIFDREIRRLIVLLASDTD